MLQSTSLEAVISGFEETKKNRCLIPTSHFLLATHPNYSNIVIL
jgi:hypothetical protein